MSSPNSALGGGFNTFSANMGLGYTKPSRQAGSAVSDRLARTRSRSPARVSVHGIEPLTSGDQGTFARHRLRRGLSCADMQLLDIISPEERSVTDFIGVPLTDAQIRRQPKKTRPYYENLDVIHDHYAEVDELLNGDLVRIIAESFRSNKRTYTMADLQDLHGNRSQARWAFTNEGEDGGELGENTPLIYSKEEQRQRIATLALNVNTIVNALLVAAKCVAVYYSSSISLVASLVDSALDLLSTFIILGTSWAIGIPSDKRKYPAGKKRFEPLGVLIFSVVMIVSFIQVFIEALQRTVKVIKSGHGEPADLSNIGIATMLATIGVKSVLWFWCSRIPSSGVQALAQDAENDVWLNVISLSFPWIGQKIGSPLLDPIGGMALSAYIIFEWIKTLLENFKNLSGKVASPDQYARILYLVTRFNPVVEIADVECYHIGDDLTIEVDVILPQDTTLHFAHDVGETIQCMLENLDGVLRAYVHCDYSSSNPAQHTARNKKIAYPVPQRSPSGQESTLSGSATPKAPTPLNEPRITTQSPEPASLVSHIIDA